MSIANFFNQVLISMAVAAALPLVLMIINDFMIAQLGYFMQAYRKVDFMDIRLIIVMALVSAYTLFYSFYLLFYDSLLMIATQFFSILLGAFFNSENN